MARAVLAAHPACARALTYVLVERAASMRRRHGDHLPLVESALAFGPGDDGEPVPARRAADRGPRVVSLGELPAVRITGVVLANELLDNLAFGLLERTESGWSEVYVGLGPDPGPGRRGFVEVLLPGVRARHAGWPTAWRRTRPSGRGSPTSTRRRCGWRRP